MNISILIADDHQLFIEGIKSLLKSEIGIEIIGEANDGIALLQLLKTKPNPDLIMTDIRMPKMDGIVATRLISNDYPKIPVLALSMYDQEADVMEMMEAGAQGYIVKNASKQELLEAIYALTNKQKYFSKELRNKIAGHEVDADNKRKYLTRREKEILKLIAKGRTSLQISQELNISKLTVDTHRKNIHKKLGIQSNAALIKHAILNFA